MLRRTNRLTPEDHQLILSAMLSGEEPYAIAVRARITVASTLRIARRLYGKALPGRERQSTAGICSLCGEPKELGQRRCVTCFRAYRREYQRANRPRHSELSDEQRRKANVRSHANVAQRRGQIVPHPCEKCESVDAEKHHDDYSRPLDVRWLCRPCHLAEHHGRISEHQTQQATP